MKHPLFVLAAVAAALVPRVSAAASTDSYTDADIGQSGYLPNHNMDPAVVDSSEFGQLWKKTFNAQEQVRNCTDTHNDHRGLMRLFCSFMRSHSSIHRLLAARNFSSSLHPRIIFEH